MKPLLLALFLFGSLAANGQSNPPDCQFTVTFKSATSGAAFNNRTSGTATPCVKWRVAYFADGLQAPVSIQLEGANDSNGSPDTWGAIAQANVYEGTNPLTSAAQGTSAMTAYYPWIRLNVTAFTTSGGPPNQIVAKVYGYKGTSASARALYYQTMDAAGTPLAQEPALNLTGAGVSCVDNPGAVRTDCTFGGGGFTNPMTTLGDMISADTGGTAKRVAGNTAAVQKFLSQTGDGVNSADPSWQLPPALGSLTYYMTPTPSTLTNLSAIVTTDNKMLTPPFSPKTAIDIAHNASADVILQSFATDPGFPGITFIPAGVYIWHIHAYRLSGNRAVTLYAVFREVSSTGTPVGTIGTQTESSTALGAAENEYPLAMADGNTYSLAGLTSRIVIDVHAVFTGGSSNTTVRMFVGGTADSHISLPSNTVDSTSFVPYSGATADVALGAHGITGAPFTGDSGSGGTTGLVPAPAAGDAAAGKYLAAGGGYGVPPGTGGSGVAACSTTPPTTGTAGQTCYDTAGLLWVCHPSGACTVAGNWISAVPYTGATADVALGAHGITGAPFTGDSGSGGTSGLVPAPAAGDAAAGKYLAAGGGYGVPPGTGGAAFYQTVDNAGTPLTQRPTLNLAGTGVSCVDNSGATRTDCTISGGGGTPGATVFSSTTTAGPNNSAAETSLIGTVTGSKTIAANTFTNGAVLQAHAQGFFSLPAVSDSLTLKMKCGTTVIGSAVLTPGAGVLTNGSWRFWLDIAARGSGAGGAFITNGLVELSGSVLTDTTSQVLNTTTVAYDFTTACVFDVTAQWGAAQVGETIQGTNVAAWFPGGSAGGGGGSTVFDLFTNRPTCNSGANGEWFIATDGIYSQYCNGSAWLSLYQGQYVTPPASASNWTALNSASITDDANAIAVSLSAASGDHLQGAYKAFAFSSGAYTATFRYTCDGIVAGGSALCGIFITDGTKIEVLGTGIDSSVFSIEILDYNSATSYNATKSSIALTNNVYGFATGFLFLRYHDDGTTNRSWSVSWDGRNWQTLYSVSRTNFLTPTGIGIVGNAGQNRFPLTIELISLIETNS